MILDEFFCIIHHALTFKINVLYLILSLCATDSEIDGSTLQQKTERMSKQLFSKKKKVKIIFCFRVVKSVSWL